MEVQGTSKKDYLFAPYTVAVQGGAENASL